MSVAIEVASLSKIYSQCGGPPAKAVDALSGDSHTQRWSVDRVTSAATWSLLYPMQVEALVGDDSQLLLEISNGIGAASPRPPCSEGDGEVLHFGLDLDGDKDRPGLVQDAFDARDEILEIVKVVHRGITRAFRHGRVVDIA